jgi:ribosome-associated translation inhibitor RaiA
MDGPTLAAVDVVTKGEVDAGAIAYARARIGHLLDAIDEPVLLARVKLVMAGDPAVEQAARAQATLDVDGTLLRAQVAGHEMHEAVDLLHRRLRDRLEHARQHREALRRHQPPPARPGEWRHGAESQERPDYFDRPADEREIVRHKSYTASELAPDEAAFEMEQLGYDFHLFRDLGSGEDAVIERAPGDGYRLRRAHRPRGAVPGDEAVSGITIDRAPAPTLTVAEAIQQLVDGGERYVFFTDAGTDRGRVLYHRYDGHYGLLMLA